MMAIPSIDMEATGRNITRLRQQAGLTVRDLQEIFGFTTPAGNLQVAARHRHAGNRQPGRAGSGTECVDR